MEMEQERTSDMTVPPIQMASKDEGAKPTATHSIEEASPKPTKIRGQDPDPIVPELQLRSSL
jgi:hypothetical protein